MPEKIYYQTQYESPLGTLTLGATGDALVGLWLPGQKYFAASVPVEMTPNNDLPIFLRTRDWLNRYFAGEQPSPAALSLAPSGSDFRRMIWDFLLEIPYGQTVTYGRLADLAARKMNRPHMSAQAVGGRGRSQSHFHHHPLPPGSGDRRKSHRICGRCGEKTVAACA